MIGRILTVGAALLGAGAAMQAQAGGSMFRDLPKEARDLSVYRWEKRPVVIFAPSREHPDYAAQMQVLQDASAALAERDIVVLSDLDDRSPGKLRQGFQPGGFKVVLIGKDGGVKLERDSVLSIEDLSTVIDSMPMRQREMRSN